jgi:hypothetical protein
MPTLQKKFCDLTPFKIRKNDQIFLTKHRSLSKIGINVATKKQPSLNRSYLVLILVRVRWVLVTLSDTIIFTIN